MNLLFVFADELRAQSVSVNNAEVATPVLDQLVTDGVYFSNAYSNMPVCTPARGSLLTGCWPHVHQAIANDLPVTPVAPSFARSLKAAGYLCGYVGKWHLGGLPRNRFVPPGEERLGFDDFWASWNCHYGHFQPRWHEDGPELHEAPGRYEPELVTENATRGLDRFAEIDEDRPFCLVVSYGPPHFPYQPLPPGMDGVYDPGALTLRANCAEDAAERQDLAAYYAHTTAVDHELGRLVARLDEAGKLDDTLVVYTSDHGTMLGSHGLHHKQVPYEESVGIPLVMRGARSKLGAAGRRDGLLIGIVDLAPTLLGILGVAPEAPMQGRDLSAEIADPGSASRPDSVHLQNAIAVDQAAWEGVPPWRAVRTDRYTYARTVDGPWLLFDNLSDPDQSKNLVDDPDAAGILAELDSLLRQSSDEAGEPLLPEREYIRYCGLEAAWDARSKWFDEFWAAMERARQSDDPEAAMDAARTAAGA
jgi:arylsulfatase A-like enzyme